MGPILVTGAAGFLGMHVCRGLAERGMSVRGMVRHPGGGCSGPGVSLVQADLFDSEAMARALSGVQTVVHLAGRAHVIHETAHDALAEFRRANVQATGLLVRAAARAGVDRLMLISSVKAVGEANTAAWTETTPACPADPYGISKLEAEAVVRSAAGAGLRTSILRLPLAYGPGVRANMLRLFDLVARRVFLPLGGISNRRSFAYSGNVVAAIAATLATPAAEGETFFVSDGEDVSTPDLLRAIGTALGVRPRLVPVPSGAIRRAGRWGDAIARHVPCPLTSNSVDRLLGSLTVDISKLRALTGFTPPFTVEAGLQETANWYRARPPAVPA